MTSRIVFFSLLLCLSLNVCGLHCGAVSADQEFFPFLAEVTDDQVNVRSGQSANFERLCQINKGEEIVVVGKEFSWYKIQLPSSARSFVSKDYVQFLGRNAGGITADRVNIRAGAGTYYTILGQLIKGEQIYIQEELDEWYRIQPVAKSYGWVADKFLAFKSKDIVKYQPAISSEISTEEESQELPELQGAKELKEPEEPEKVQEQLTEKEVEKPVQPKKTAKIEKVEKAEKPEKIKKVNKFVKAKKIEEAAETKTKKVKSFSAVGYVELYEKEGNDGVYYKIVTDDKPVCYIQGLNHMLGRFLHHQVKVEGVTNQELQSQYDRPVIVVSKVKLML